MLPKNILFTMLTIVILLSCNKESKLKIDESQTEDLDSLMRSLDTQEKKEQFLIDVHDKDQDIRNPDKTHEILKRNNYNTQSQEYQDQGRKMMFIDSINFLKTLKYLKEYGHPNSKDFSKKACYAIRIIALHQPYERQLELFPYLYKAYNDGFINSERFSFLLNNMHRSKYEESHPHAISYEENIEQLLEKLQLK